MEEYNLRILKAKQVINNADYILIGSGAGLSTEAGLEYSGKSKEMVEEWIELTENCEIPEDLVPKCPICGKNMDMNLRKDSNFVQDENWYKQSKKYYEFLDKTKNKNVVLIEIGAGFNTPGIIRFPFEQMVYNDLKTTLIRINKDYPQTMLEIGNKTISFDENTSQVIEDLKEN